MIVNVKIAPDGEKFTVEVDDMKISVTDFKAKLEIKSKVPADQQRLIYKGHVLRDGRTLESYCKS